MAGRNLVTAQSSVINGSDMSTAVFVRLDILNDPIFCWTGLGNYVASGTTDVAFNGFTFMGLGNIGQISKITDTNAGSDTVTLTLPGVNLTDDALRQVVFNRATYQFRKAWIWLGLFDTSNALIGPPIRLKVGRMNTMTAKKKMGEGSIECSIESFANYQQESLYARYSEQKGIVDSTDISQDFVAQLANQTAVLGSRNANGGSGGGGGSLSGMGSGHMNSV